MQLILLAKICLVIFLKGVSSQNTDLPEVHFKDPSTALGVSEGKSKTISWNSSVINAVNVAITGSDDFISEVTRSYIDTSDGIWISGNFTVDYKFIGFNDITVTLLDENDEEIAEGVLKTSAILSYQVLSDVFTWSITVLLALVYVNMGATIDLKVIKSIIYKPIGPSVGLFCQYIVMPLVSYLLGLALFDTDDVWVRLGLFLNGTCPGGGASNMYTLLLGGSLTLSVMMTFCSTIIAFAMIPLWVLTMGPVILGDTEFVVPYGQIAILMVSLTVPCGIGIVIQLKLPRVQKFLAATLVPLALFNLTYSLTFGIYVNRYIFHYATWKLLLSAAGLPYIGYCAGMGIAFLLRMPTKDIITVGVETGLQNTLIALIILKTTLGSPAGDIAFCVPAFSTCLTPIPLFIGIIGRYIHMKFFKKEIKDKAETGKDNLGIEIPEGKFTEKKETQFKVSGKDGIDNPGAELHDIPA